MATLDPAVRVGHVHLKVADLDRAVAFYHGVLGLDVTLRLGDTAAFLSAGGYHHHVGLNTWESAGGSPPPPGTTGLYHLALVYPTRPALADALRRLIAAGIPLDGASDHGVSHALYLRDPDQNGVELYWDRPREQWPRTADGQLAMYTGPLDLRELLAEGGEHPLAAAIRQLSRELHVGSEPLAAAWLPTTAAMIEPAVAIDLLAQVPDNEAGAWRSYLLVGLIFYGLVHRAGAFPGPATLSGTTHVLQRHQIGLRRFVELNVPPGVRTDDQYGYAWLVGLTGDA